MNENKEELQIQVSELLHKDIVKIVTSYSKNGFLLIDEIALFIQDIILLKTYNVTYLHNNELNEIISLMQEELIVQSPSTISFLTGIDYLLNKEKDLKKALYVYLFLKVPKENFQEAFSIFSVMNASVKDLFSDFMKYIFNDSFLTLDDNIQIDCIYKAWNFSQQLFHDNEASIYAYSQLKLLFDKAIKQEKTEVVLWLYYTPLHYYNSGTSSDIEKVNDKFKAEIEKPLEKYIQKVLIPKYNIKANLKVINKNKKIKVAFVIQRIIKHSTINVFYSLIKSLMEDKNKEYEFIIYDIAFTEAGGSDSSYVEDFKKLGIKYINLHEAIFGNTEPTYSLLTKCIETRNILIEDEIDIFIGLHTRAEYVFLYSTRSTAKQIYWYHGSNAQYHIDGIDYRLTHGNIGFDKVNYNGFEFLQFPDIMDNTFLDNKVDSNIIDIERNKYPEEALIIGTIGRLVKIDEEYIKIINQLMKENSNIIYIACGGGDKEFILSRIDNNLLSRWYFPGYVSSSLYGEIIDIFANTFPTPQGLSALEIMAKGKNVITLKNISQNYEAQKYAEKKYYKNLSYPLVAKDINEYIQTLNSLVKMSENERKENGNCFKLYVKEAYDKKNSIVEFYKILLKVTN